MVGRCSPARVPVKIRNPVHARVHIRYCFSRILLSRMQERDEKMEGKSASSKPPRAPETCSSNVLLPQLTAARQWTRHYRPRDPNSTNTLVNHASFPEPFPISCRKKPETDPSRGNRIRRCGLAGLRWGRGQGGREQQKKIKIIIIIKRRIGHFPVSAPTGESKQTGYT